MRESRYKILAISPEAIVHLLGGWKHRDYLRLPTLVRLPSDVEVMCVNADWANNIIQVKLWHPSFPIVPDGQIVLRLDSRELEIETVQLLRDQSLQVEDLGCERYIVPAREEL
jgi:hypothetical protein